jgi:hypothetical protein
MNWTYHLLVHAADVNGQRNIIKDTHAPLDASKEVGLETNAEKTQYMFMTRGQNASQNHNIKIANKSFKN